MHKGRLEAFTDAVIAIILTIMVLDLRAPEKPTLASLGAEAPHFISYALSFVFLAIYWNNHHHMFQSVEKINGAALWASMHLLFWLSLVPFTTAWLAQSQTAIPVAIYGMDLILCGIAYYILTRVLIRVNGTNSRFAKALGNDIKGKISPVIYGVGIGVAFVWPSGSCILYAAVAAMWLIPDRRFEGNDETYHSQEPH
jgi:uncharacterized membrane protein